MDQENALTSVTVSGDACEPLPTFRPLASWISRLCANRAVNGSLTRGRETTHLLRDESHGHLSDVLIGLLDLLLPRADHLSRNDLV